MSFFASLKNSLLKTSDKITQNISAIFSNNKIDQASLDEFEDFLITTDIGIQNAKLLREKLSKAKFEKNNNSIDVLEIKNFLSNEIYEILKPYEKQLTINEFNKPHTIMIIGVNGVGKTTTIAKITQALKDKYTLSIVACDTFRAGAVEQIEIWAKRLNVNIYKDANKDPSSLAFDAYKSSIDKNDDVLIIDTAGRMHNKPHLMDELQKIKRTLAKINTNSPHTTLMIIDATTGQNALEQVKIFNDYIKIDGIIMTKLDGTAKGGILINIAKTYNLPIHYIGIGEKADDLKEFKALEFAKALMNLD